jgi:H+/Cl- antiporter ClcA
MKNASPFHAREFWLFLKSTTKWLLIGSLVGILAGTASAIFLISLNWVTETRMANPWLLYFLPLAGFVMGWVYWRFGGDAAKGNNLVIDEVNHNRSKIPRRMMPFVLVGTLITHLFGGSAGREGTAIQMGASLADGLRRLLNLRGDERRLILIAGISGGFGSVFGVPAAGFVFGMEVQSVGRVRYEGMIPCLVASFIGDLVTRSLGAPHSHYPAMAITPIDPFTLAKVSLAAILFGLTSMLFIELVHGIKTLNHRLNAWKPLHPVFGGIAIIALSLLLGTNDYLGLGLPLIHESLEGSNVFAFAFLLKLLFTAITLGSGFLGGEVTPLFVIGATLGYSLANLLGLDPHFLASIGLVAVFAGASNTPLACAIMGIELFGGGGALYLFLACALAYLASGHRGIYTTQLVGVPKFAGYELKEGDSLETIRQNGHLPKNEDESPKN